MNDSGGTNSIRVGPCPYLGHEGAQGINESEDLVSNEARLKQFTEMCTHNGGVNKPTNMMFRQKGRCSTRHVNKHVTAGPNKCTGGIWSPGITITQEHLLCVQDGPVSNCCWCRRHLLRSIGVTINDCSKVLVFDPITKQDWTRGSTKK